MSHPRKNMKEIRNIFTVRLLQPEASNRYIASVNHCSRPVVTNYLQNLKQNPLTLSELQSINDQELASYLQLEPRNLQETETNRQLNS